MLLSKNRKILFRLRNATFLVFTFLSICFSQTTWKVINAPPQSNILHSVTYGNGLFVAVGDSGIILTSSNCTTWTIKSSGTTKHISSVTYGNGRFVAIGDTSLTSPDGAIWSTTNSDLSTHQYSNFITFYNGQFVAVDGGNISTSPDGTIWTIKRLFYENLDQTIDNLTSVTYGKGLFLAVGYKEVIDDNYCCGAPITYVVKYGLIFTSSDGKTWTQKDSGTIINYFTSVTYGNGLFVAVGFGSNICTSQDGVTWTLNWVTSNINSVTYGNGQFVAVGDRGKLFTSFDDTTWTQQNSGTINRLSCVTYANGIFVAVGDSGTILTSKADPVRVTFQTKAKSIVTGLKINIMKNCISAILPDAATHGQLNVCIFNISGKQIYSATKIVNNGSINIPAKGFPTGKYFMSIIDEKNRTINSSFVLAR